MTVDEGQDPAGYPGAAAHPRPGASAGFRGADAEHICGELRSLPLNPGAAALSRAGRGTGFRGAEHYFPPACRAAPLNANDELTQTVDASNGTTTYQYDANGSQTTVTSPTGTTTNVYDLQGRVISVVNKNTSGVVTSSATYIYDDQGNPDPSLSPAEIGTSLLAEITVTGTNAPVTTYFLVDTQTATGYAQVIEQSQTPGTPAATYVWGETLISQNDAPGTANAGTYYLIADAHGSTVALLDASGNVVQTFHYDAFGSAIGFTISSAITPYLYNQQFFDIISGQYYLRSRNYDPATGTFTQQDTINLQPGDLANANFYLFAGADPVNMFGPSGHDLMETLGAIAIGTMLGSMGIGTGIGAFQQATGESITPDAAILGFSITASPSALAAGLGKIAGGGFSALPAFSAAGNIYPFSKVLFSISAFSGIISSRLLSLEEATHFSGGVTAGVEILADRRDDVLGLYGFIGGAAGIAAGSSSVSGSIYDGVAWDVPKWTDYAGPFVTLSGGVSAGMFGGGISLFANPANWRQHGMLTSATVGAGSGGVLSLTKYYSLGELGQGAALVSPFLWAAWPPPYDAMMAMSLGNS